MLPRTPQDSMIPQYPSSAKRPENIMGAVVWKGPNIGKSLHELLAQRIKRTEGWGRQSIRDSAAYWAPCVMMGAARIDSKEIEPFITNLWGQRRDAYKEIYRYVLTPETEDLPPNPKHVSILGFAPNGITHLGHRLHMTAQQDSAVDQRIASFNDVEAKQVRHATDEEIAQSMSSFYAVLDPEQVTFERRTQVPEVVALQQKLQEEVTDLDYYYVFSRELTEAEKLSLNWQAAGYLWRSVQDPSIIPIGYDGIEELLRPAYINYVAQRFLNLPGGYFFISPQLQGWDPSLKMGKSNPEGSLQVGSSLAEAVTRIEHIPDSREGRFLVAAIAFMFSDRNAFESDLPFEELKGKAIANLQLNHRKFFPLKP